MVKSKAAEVKPWPSPVRGASYHQCVLSNGQQEGKEGEADLFHKQYVSSHRNFGEAHGCTVYSVWLANGGCASTLKFAPSRSQKPALQILTNQDEKKSQNNGNSCSFIT